jgi:hypothetical protein
MHIELTKFLKYKYLNSKNKKYMLSDKKKKNSIRNMMYT